MGPSIGNCCLVVREQAHPFTGLIVSSRLSLDTFLTRLGSLGKRWPQIYGLQLIRRLDIWPVLLDFFFLYKLLDSLELSNNKIRLFDAFILNNNYDFFLGRLIIQFQAFFVVLSSS